MCVFHMNGCTIQYICDGTMFARLIFYEISCWIAFFAFVPWLLVSVYSLCIWCVLVIKEMQMRLIKMSAVILFLHNIIAQHAIQKLVRVEFRKCELCLSSMLYVYD